jgi:uncharacterized protein YbaP (TraB family)
MRTLARLIARLTALFVALIALPAYAQGPAPAASAPVAAAAEPEVRPALWKVADGDTTIWLFGTVHALPPGIEWYRGPIAKAFEGSQQLVTEIVPPDPGQMQAIVVSKAMLPKGQTLRATMPADERSRFETALATQGLPASAFDPFEPWYAAVGLSTMPLLRDGFASANGVEETLDTRARALGLPHAALETAEYQLSLFDGLPAQTQRVYLDEVIKNLPTMKQQLLQMVDAWKVGDADRLARLINEDEDDPALLETLLINRNRNWAQWIGQRLKTPGTVFVAVGAGHLAGNGSVQEQLAKAGITAQRVQ